MARVVVFSSALAALSSMHPGAVAAVAGAPRTGKSLHVKAADARGAFPRRVTFDPFWRRDRIEALHRSDIAPWSGQVVSTRELLMRRELLCYSPLSLVVAPETLDQEELGADFNAVAELVWAAGGIDLIGEEAGQYSRAAAAMMMRFATGGGHVNARLVLITQSMGRIHIDARKSLSHVVCFAQGAQEDLDAIRARCGRPFAERIRRLRVPQKPGDPLDPPEIWRLGDALEAA